jgi:hypothetical protein
MMHFLQCEIKRKPSLLCFTAKLHVAALKINFRVCEILWKSLSVITLAGSQPN